MKHNNKYFLQLSRELFKDKYKDLSIKAKWLFVVLNELEQRYSGENEDFFYRSNDDLAKDAGMSLRTFKRVKKELENTDLIETWLIHWIDPKTGKKSKKKITAYRILK